MRFIVVGCGREGAGLARHLSQRGHRVTVVDREPASFQRLGPSFQGQTIAGVGFDHKVLLDAGIERADGLAALTNSDEANVVTARVAKQFFRVPRVVACLYDPQKAEVYRRLGLHAITPATWGIQRMAELLCYSSLHSVMSLGNGEVDVVEVEAPHLLAGQTVEELTVPGEVLVVAITRGGRTFVPVAKTVLQEGDLIHVVAQTASADRLKSLFGLV